MKLHKSDPVSWWELPSGKTTPIFELHYDIAKIRKLNIHDEFKAFCKLPIASKPRDGTDYFVKYLYCSGKDFNPTSVPKINNFAGLQRYIKNLMR